MRILKWEKILNPRVWIVCESESMDCMIILKCENGYNPRVWIVCESENKRRW